MYSSNFEHWPGGGACLQHRLWAPMSSRFGPRSLQESLGGYWVGGVCVLCVRAMRSCVESRGRKKLPCTRKRRIHSNESGRNHVVRHVLNTTQTFACRREQKSTKNGNMTPHPHTSLLFQFMEQTLIGHTMCYKRV